jgi:hypothetical protein
LGCLKPTFIEKAERDCSISAVRRAESDRP